MKEGEIGIGVPNPSRREFFKKMFWGGVIFDAAYSTRVLQARHEITHDVIIELERQSVALVPTITFLGEEQLKSSNRTKKVQPNAEACVQMLLFMAYYEDGANGVSKTIQAISRQGLEIVFEPQSFYLGGSFEAPGDKPYQITINSTVVEGRETLLSHELYHAHQFIQERGGFGLRAIIDSLVYLSLSGHIIDHTFNEIDRVDRRTFLTIMKGMSYFTSFNLVYLFLCRPNELQDYIQTGLYLLPGIPSIPGLLSFSPQFINIANRLFTENKEEV